MGSVIDAAVNIGSFGAINTDFSGKKAGENALNAQTNAAHEANARTVENLSPWQNAGLEALKKLQDNKFDMTKDAGYDFRLKEGQKAIDMAANANGRYNNGGTLKALARYGSDYASNEYDKAYNRDYQNLNNLANYGYNASNGIAGVTSQNAIGVGNANAANSIGQVNRDNQMIGQAVGLGTAALTGGFGGGGAEKMATLGGGGGGGPLGGQYSLGNYGIDSKYLVTSDIRTKNNIQSIPKSELAEMKKHLKAYYFNYISPEHGSGDWAGIMTQDLEKSKLGRTMVVTDKNGIKQLDIAKVMCVFLATMAEG